MHPKMSKSCAAALCAATFVALSATGAPAAPAYVASTVNLRAAPGTTNEIIGKIPGGSLVDADNCNDGWCEVTWQGKSGYAIKSALDTSGRVPARRSVARSSAPRVVADDDDIDVGPPAYYGAPAVYPYYSYRPFGYYRYRPYYGYGYRGGWRRRW